MINIGHVDRYFHDAGFFPYRNDDPVFRAAFGERIQGSDIYVDLPGVPDGIDSQHNKYRYQSTSELIASELTQNSADNHPFDVRAYSYVIGTSSLAPQSLSGSDRNDVIIGTPGSESLFGFSGNDIIDGGPGNDTIYGGLGNDIIYGGLGNDTVIFTQARGQYTISVQGRSIIVSPITSAAQIDGTDTVNTDAANYGVENFRFSDGTYTLTQLLPPPPRSRYRAAGSRQRVAGRQRDKCANQHQRRADVQRAGS